MLQMKFGHNRDCLQRRCCLRVLTTDDNERRRRTTAYPISSPGAFGSGELKSRIFFGILCVYVFVVVYVQFLYITICIMYWFTCLLMFTYCVYVVGSLYDTYKVAMFSLLVPDLPGYTETNKRAKGPWIAHLSKKVKGKTRVLIWTNVIVCNHFQMVLKKKIFECFSMYCYGSNPGPPGAGPFWILGPLLE